MNHSLSLVKSKDLGKWVQKGSRKLRITAVCREANSSICFLHLQKADFYLCAWLYIERACAEKNVAVGGHPGALLKKEAPLK